MVGRNSKQLQSSWINKTQLSESHCRVWPRKIGFVSVSICLPSLGLIIHSLSFPSLIFFLFFSFLVLCICIRFINRTSWPHFQIHEKKKGLVLPETIIKQKKSMYTELANALGLGYWLQGTFLVWLSGYIIGMIVHFCNVIIWVTGPHEDPEG